MDTRDPMFVAGHRGMVGSALVRALEREGYTCIIWVPRRELDLLDQASVRRWFSVRQPRYVFVAAAKVWRNTREQYLATEFIYQNMMIAANVIEASWRQGSNDCYFLVVPAAIPGWLPSQLRSRRF